MMQRIAATAFPLGETSMEQALASPATPPRQAPALWQALGLSLALHALVAALLVALAMHSDHTLAPAGHNDLQIVLRTAPARAHTSSSATVASTSASQATPSQTIRSAPAPAAATTTPAATPAHADTPPPVLTTAAAPVSVPVAATNPAPAPSTGTTPASAATAAQPGSATTGSNSPITPDGDFVAANADAAYLNNPKPEYPWAAKRQGVEGKVLLRVVVSNAGVPLDVSVLDSSRSSLLDQAALSAVRQWRFVPARHGTQPVQDTIRVPVVFNLNTQG